MPTQSEKDWRPRLSIELTPEQYNGLKDCIPYRMQRLVFSALVDLLLAAFQRGGMGVLVSIMEKELDLPGLFIKPKE